jgi:hypothetical protein
MGVPLSDDPVIPTLVFHTTADSLENTALTGDVTFTKAAGTFTGESALSCSFEGGCLYSITGTGLASSLAGNDDNKVMVCGNECLLDLDASDVTTAKCAVPSLMTTYSASTFDMASSATLAGTWAGTGSSSELAKLNDGNNLDSYSDSSSPCSISLSA